MQSVQHWARRRISRLSLKEPERVGGHGEDGKPISIKRLRHENPLGLIALCTNDPGLPPSIPAGSWEVYPGHVCAADFAPEHMFSGKTLKIRVSFFFLSPPAGKHLYSHMR